MLQPSSSSQQGQGGRAHSQPAHWDFGRPDHSLDSPVPSSDSSEHCCKSLVMAADKIVPKLKAEEEEEEDEEPIDMAVIIKEKCGEEHCSKYKDRLDECNQRVKSKNETTETCFEEILDFYHCVDHCASKDIFKHMK